MQVRSLGQEDPLEEGMAPHSSILARSIPRTEEPGRLQSMSVESQRVGHDCKIEISTDICSLKLEGTPSWFLFMHQLYLI